MVSKGKPLDKFVIFSALDFFLWFNFSGFSPSQRVNRVTEGLASLQVSNGHDM